MGHPRGHGLITMTKFFILQLAHFESTFAPFQFWSSSTVSGVSTNKDPHQQLPHKIWPCRLTQLLSLCDISSLCVFKWPHWAPTYPLSSRSCLIKPDLSNECQRQTWSWCHLRWKNLTACSQIICLTKYSKLIFLFYLCTMFEFDKFVGGQTLLQLTKFRQKNFQKNDYPVQRVFAVLNSNEITPPL